MKELDPDESNLLFDNQFSIRDVIEQGPFSNVYRIVQGGSNRKFILRSICLNLFKKHTGLGPEDIDEEIRICQNLQHPYVCRLEKTINSINYRHMIFENMEGNDICFEIVQRACNGFVFSEYVVSHYTRQLLDALDYCHSRNLVHRDVRPHNLVLATKDTSAPMKLCGFSVAKDLSTGGSSASCGRVGVPQFMAPEIVKKDRMSCSSDIWSSGVVLFLLLAGRLPFTGTTSDIYAQIMEGVVDVDGYMPNISESARNLVRRMLTADPAKRITAKEALNHEWIRDKEHMASRKHMNNVIDHMRRYNESRKLKSNVLSAVNSGRFDETTPRHDTSQTTAFVDGSSPGGDCCQRGESSTNEATEQPTNKDLSGAYKVLASLDAINSLSDPNSYKTGNSTIEKIQGDGSVRNLLRVRTNNLETSSSNFSEAGMFSVSVSVSLFIFSFFTKSGAPGRLRQARRFNYENRSPTQLE
uniref:Protein kinase domain-containing protein n=1 Tax=Caenorhabditis japonica TaxID=281687 RepID=A0A8R1HLK4_CAEJA